MSESGVDPTMIYPTLHAFAFNVAETAQAVSPSALVDARPRGSDLSAMRWACADAAAYLREVATEIDRRTQTNGGAA